MRTLLKVGGASDSGDAAVVRISVRNDSMQSQQRPVVQDVGTKETYYDVGAKETY
jgi:hypothetical protein